MKESEDSALKFANTELLDCVIVESMSSLITPSNGAQKARGDPVDVQ